MGHYFESTNDVYDILAFFHPLFCSYWQVGCTNIVVTSCGFCVCVWTQISGTVPLFGHTVQALGKGGWERQKVCGKAWDYGLGIQESIGRPGQIGASWAFKRCIRGRSALWTGSLKWGVNAKKWWVLNFAYNFNLTASCPATGFQFKVHRSWFCILFPLCSWRATS